MMDDYRSLYNFADGLLGNTSGGGSNTTITIQPSDLHLNGAPQKVDGSTVGNLLGVVYLVAGIVAVVVIVIAGIRYTTSNGDSNQIQAAKNMTFYSVIGIVVIIMAAGVTQFILQNVAK